MVTGRQAARGAKVERLISRILAGTVARESEKFDAWRKPAGEIRKLVKQDYVRSLRRVLPYRRLLKLVSAYAEVLPEFNRQPVGMMSTQRLARRALDLDLHFKAAPYEENDGLALRGFYVNRSNGVLKRPLIYVNTAHHPLAVSATFCHEVGHHVVAEVVGSDEESVHFFFDADYVSHLEEPGELAADVMVSFAGYPEPIARRIFAEPWQWGLVARAKNLTEAALNEVRGHIKKVYGFDLMARIPAHQRLHYLSGMIHYAKLRWALLAEYDV
ncbi:hypothetical protein IMX07_16950 [bacterium]|nr:hypothetical protein [bacterium]